jgi:hypothetical protein
VILGGWTETTIGSTFDPAGTPVAASTPRLEGVDDVLESLEGPSVHIVSSEARDDHRAASSANCASALGRLA